MENLDEIRKLTNSLSRVENNLKNEKSTLEFILEHTTDGYWDWNVVTGYEYLSPKFKSQLGYTVDEMENKPESWQKICNPEDAAKLWDQVQNHFSGNQEDIKGVLRFTHKEGHEIQILCRGKLVERSEDGSPLRMIGTHVIL
jgi:PAS domain S-box-containing protein